MAVLGTLILAIQVWAVPAVWRKPKQFLTYGDIAGPILATMVGVFMLVNSWHTLNERYLLRPGAGHYTVATITELDNWRGEPRFTCAFYVAGQRYQLAKLCGTVAGHEVPCPALHSRRYVHFAPDDPNLVEVTDVAVPDSVRNIPPLGWNQLP